MIRVLICTAASWQQKSNEDPAGVYHDNSTVFHFSEMKFETAAHLLRRRCIASFSSRESERKQLNGKRREESSVWGKTSPQQNTFYKSINANDCSPNTFRNSWLSELPALLLARHVYGPPSPCRMCLTVSVLLPPSSVFSTYCSDRSITWPFLWTQTTSGMELTAYRNTNLFPVQLVCVNSFGGKKSI